MPVVLCSIFAAMLAQAAPPSAAPIRIVTQEGELLDAMEVTYDADRGIQFRGPDGREHGIPVDRVDRIDALRADAAPAKGPWEVNLRSGGRLSGDIAGGDENTFVLAHARLGELRLPIDAIQSIHRAGRGAAPAAAGAAQDEIRLVNGDVDAGLVAALSRDHLTLLDGDMQREISWRVVQSVRFTAPPTARRSAALPTLMLVGGDRLVARSFRLAGEAVRVTTAEGDALTLPLSAVSRVELAGGRRTWLSDVPPARTEVTPLFSTRWQPTVDRAVDGGPLRILGQVYDKGLGLHARTVLAWELDGGYTQLTGRIGVDDSGGPWSDVDVRVRVDGTRVADYTGLRHGEPPRDLHVDLHSARELVIEVDFGRNGDVQDRVSLVNPVLHR